MLPRRLRLSQEGFQPSGARRAASEHFSASLAGVEGPGSIAFVASKKVARRAVDRNRLKRRALVVLWPFVAPDRALIVYARTGSPTLSFSALADELSVLVRGMIR